jgi:hypothetical protein
MQLVFLKFHIFFEGKRWLVLLDTVIHIKGLVGGRRCAYPRENFNDQKVIPFPDHSSHETEPKTVQMHGEALAPK